MNVKVVQSTRSTIDNEYHTDSPEYTHAGVLGKKPWLPGAEREPCCARHAGASRGFRIDTTRKVGTTGATMDLTVEEAAAIRIKVEMLRVEHRDLDEVIERLSHDQELDELRLRRLKRRKLLLKDQIAILESRLVPDIPA